MSSIIFLLYALGLGWFAATLLFEKMRRPSDEPLGPILVSKLLAWIVSPLVWLPGWVAGFVCAMLFAPEYDFKGLHPATPALQLRFDLSFLLGFSILAGGLLTVFEFGIDQAVRKTGALKCSTRVRFFDWPLALNIVCIGACWSAFRALNAGNLI